MPGAIDDEIQFVRRAVDRYGPSFAAHLRSKGFTCPTFLHQWAAVTEILDRFPPPGPRVLDLGCGPGWSSIFLAARGLHVTAADISADMLAIARENAHRLAMSIEFLQLDMRQSLTAAGDPFDFVLVLDALHHCPDERPVLRHCFDALRPGGVILLIEPDWFHQFSPASRHDRECFGTTERGLSFRRLKRSFRAAGFIHPRRFYLLYDTPTRNPVRRLRSLAAALLTLTAGYPHRSVIALAHRPA